MNLSELMLCPSCGKEMGNGGCRLGTGLTTYTRNCTCGCSILCVPMEKDKHYEVRMTDDAYDEQRRKSELKVKECRKALEEAERELKYL